MKASFKTGAIALAFLVLGFELALFVHRAAVERVVADLKPTASRPLPSTTGPSLYIRGRIWRPDRIPCCRLHNQAEGGVGPMRVHPHALIQ